MNRRTWILTALIVLLAEAACAPFLGNHWFQTHDVSAYPVRVVEYVQGWRSGFLFPRWSPDMYGGFGSPFFNYYAPGLFVVSGLFLLLGATAAIAVKCGLLVFTAVGGLALFHLVREETARDDAAFVAAVVFLFMPYRFTQMYVRGDMAEYAAIALVPLALWGYRALMRRSSESLAAVACATALAHASVIFTHTLTGQWATELIGVVVTLTAVQSWRHDRRRAWIILATFGAGVALSTIYTLPAMIERPLVHIDRMTEGGFHTSRNVFPLHTFTEPGFFYIGRAVLYGVVAAILAIALRGTKKQRLVMAGWTIATIALIASMLPWSVWLWDHLPLARYLQFPWRMLGFIAVAGATLVGLVWAVALPSRRLTWVLAAVAACAAIWDGSRNIPSPLLPLARADIPSTPSEILHSNLSTVVSDEYLPRPHERPPNVLALRFADSTTVEIEKSVRGATDYRFSILAPEGGRLTVHSFWFPGWAVATKNGPARATIGPSDTGELLVHFPEAGRYDIVVYFGSTPLRTAAAMLTLLSAFLFLWLVRRLTARR